MPLWKNFFYEPQNALNKIVKVRGMGDEVQ